MSPTTKRIVKIFIGLISIPLIIASFQAFIIQLKSFAMAHETIPYYFFGGFTAYLVFQSIFFKPMRTYVFGHELTHALWSMMFGGRVKKFVVRQQNGKVLLTKTNFLINLAPYFFPIYSFFVFIIYLLLKCFEKERPFLGSIIFLLGITFSFHLALLLHAFSLRQSDIKKTGRLFSLTLIILFNIIIAVFILKFMLPGTIDLQAFSWQTLNVTRAIWTWLMYQSYHFAEITITIIRTWFTYGLFQ